MVEQHNSVLLCVNEGEIELNWEVPGENGYFLAACQKQPSESLVFAVSRVEPSRRTAPLGSVCSGVLSVLCLKVLPGGL